MNNPQSPITSVRIGGINLTLGECIQIYAHNGGNRSDNLQTATVFIAVDGDSGIIRIGVCTHTSAEQCMPPVEVITDGWVWVDEVDSHPNQDHVSAIYNRVIGRD